MDNHFKNININDDIELQMDFYNLDTCVVNSFRRSVLSDVLGYTFGDIIIEKNTSLLNNEILAHRLSLIPLEMELGDNISVELDVKNNGFDKISITSSDLKVVSGELYIIPNILMVELKSKEEISLKMTVIRGSGKEHAKFQPVSICSYKINEEVSIKMDIWNKLSKSQKDKCRKYCKRNLLLKNDYYLYENSVGTYGFKVFNENTKEKIRLNLKKYLIKIGVDIEEEESNDMVIFTDKYYNKKYVYSFKLESLLVNPYYIFSQILYHMNKKIIDLQNKDIEIDNHSCNVGICFIIEGEGHTMGTILVEEIQKDDRVKYSYYKQKHPFDKKILLYIILKEENDDNESEYAIILVDAFKRIVEMYQNLQAEWNLILQERDVNMNEIIEI